MWPKEPNTTLSTPTQIRQTPEARETQDRYIEIAPPTHSTPLHRRGSAFEFFEHPNFWGHKLQNVMFCCVQEAHHQSTNQPCATKELAVRWPGPATNGQLVFTHADPGWVTRFPRIGAGLYHFWVGPHSPGHARS